MYLLFLLLMLVAWLPLWLLYGLSNVSWPILYYIVRYRRKVTDTNLKKSFPEKSDKELKTIAKRYYRHITDLLVEALFNLRTTPQQVKQHYHITNRQILDKYYEQGKSVILVSAHYNNWEYMVVGLNMMLRHHGVGVGKPLDDKRFGKHLTKKRTRFGTEVVDFTNVRETFAYYDAHKVPVAYMMLADQSPSNEHKSYWTHFLNQETPFLYGAEYFARKYNYPVLFYKVEKTKRGYYQVTFSELCDNPLEVPQYTITKKYVSLLNDLLHEKPEYWLWSHKRWKRKRPQDMPLYE